MFANRRIGESLSSLPSLEPDEETREWQFGGNGWLQVIVNPERAGGSTVVLGVTDLDAHVDEMNAAGVILSEVQDYGFVRLAGIADSDGNGIQFVEEADEVA